MAKILSSPGETPFLPKGAADFLKRRFCELLGLCLLGFAAALLATLASYTPGDPSLNSVTGGGAGNLLGVPGAYAADLLLQTAGFAGAVPSVVLGAWGWKYLRKDRVNRVWLRLALIPVAAALCATALAALPPPENWPLVAGPGGVAGAMILAKLAALGASFSPAVNPAALGFAAAILSAAAVVAAMGVTLADGRTVMAGAGRALAAAVRWTRRGHAAARAMGDLRGRIEPVLSGPKRRAVAEGEPWGPAPRQPTNGLVAPKAAMTKTGRKARAARQRTLDLGPADEYQAPPLDLLKSAPGGAARGASQSALQENARYLASVLEDFGVQGDVVKVRPGPVVTLYELEPAPGTKTSRVIGLADDIARSMSAVSVRVAVVPGRNVIGIELPNTVRETVYLREILESENMERSTGKLSLALGKDISGAPVIVDLTRMPHLLIAGTTGSGKSVAINTMILSLLYQHPPEECKFIMIDPKMLELSVYEGIPHLISPVVTDPSKAVLALKWAVREMEERYRAMSHLGVRSVAGYNARLAEARETGEALLRRVQTGFDDAGNPVFEEQPLNMEPLPLIVVVVDEMADLMLVAGKDIEAAVQRLAQMARAAGIHLITATQRPSVDVITGTIKANFPTRISFQVTSRVDSRTILGEQGAEQLLGHGDMLFMAGGGRISRVHGPLVSDAEVESVVRVLKSQGAPTYIDEVTEEPDEPLALSGGESGDELYDDAVALIAREGKASTSFVQRHLQIGYNRAARIIERMEEEGIVSTANRVGRREVLIGNSAHSPA